LKFFWSKIIIIDLFSWINLRLLLAAKEREEKKDEVKVKVEVEEVVPEGRHPIREKKVRR